MASGRFKSRCRCFAHAAGRDRRRGSGRVGLGLEVAPGPGNLHDRHAGSPGCRSRRLRRQSGSGSRETALATGRAPPAPTNTATAFQRTDLNAASTVRTMKIPRRRLRHGSSGNQRAEPARGRWPPDQRKREQRSQLAFRAIAGVRKQSPRSAIAVQRKSRIHSAKFQPGCAFVLANRPGYAQARLQPMQGLASFGGPLKIPRLLETERAEFHGQLPMAAQS